MSELAIDTSTAACAVALRLDGQTFVRAPQPGRMLEQPAHARELLPAIEDVCRESDTALAAVTVVAVGIGPGAFTGLRIGVSTARAIATSLGIEIKPVSSLATLVGGAKVGRDAKLPGAVIAMIDARRNEIFYSVSDNDDSLGSPDEVIAVASELASTGGLLAVGDGALKLRDRLLAEGVEVPLADDPRHVVNGSVMLDIADSIAPLSPDAVTPNYIRAPDAKVSSRESWLVGSEAK